jgi:hypothetical protein
MLLLPSGEGPVLEGIAVGGIKPNLVGRPEPAVDVLGGKVLTITTVKVAKTTGSPDIFDACNSKRC